MPYASSGLLLAANVPFSRGRRPSAGVVSYYSRPPTNTVKPVYDEPNFTHTGGSLMRFYTNQHKFYCGIDLHARKMYLCVLDQNGEIRLHRNIDTDRGAFLKAIEPFQEDVVVAVECMFTWYWIADLCQSEGIPFVLGHVLYVKAILRSLCYA